MRKLITYLVAGLTFMVLGCIIESVYANSAPSEPIEQTVMVKAE